MRRIARRRLNRPASIAASRNRDLGDVLAEIELRRRRRAKGATAHIGAVEIGPEDFLLAQIGLEPEGQEGFLDLALDRRSLVRNRFLANCWVMVEPP